MAPRGPGLRAWAFLLTTSLFAVGLIALAFAGGRSATADDSANLPYASHLAGLAGDSAHGSGSPATATPSQTASPTATSTPPGQTCSSGHGALLGFGDPGVASVTRTPLETTVGALRSLAAPSTVPADATRLGPFETTVYSLTANLVSMARLSDGTVVLLVGDSGGGATVPVFLPPRSCTSGAAAADQGTISGAAIALREACGDAPAVGAGPQALAGSATLTGTGFWSSANIDGAPPNGASLGPVLSFSFSGDSCDPAHVTPTPTPSPTPPVAKTHFGTVDAPTNNTYYPGEAIELRASIVPSEPGIQCTMYYYGPPPTMAMLSGPTSSTDATGVTPIWSFNIPADSLIGEGKATAYCGGVPATTSIYITTAP